MCVCVWVFIYVYIDFDSVTFLEILTERETNYRKSNTVNSCNLKRTSLLSLLKTYIINVYAVKVKNIFVLFHLTTSFLHKNDYYRLVKHFTKRVTLFFEQEKIATHDEQYLGANHKWYFRL